MKKTEKKRTTKGMSENEVSGQLLSTVEK